MLKRIAEITVKSRIKRHNLIRKKRFMNWDKINKIALVISESELVNKSVLDTFIAKTGKHIEVFYVGVNSKQATYRVLGTPYVCGGACPYTRRLC